MVVQKAVAALLCMMAKYLIEEYNKRPALNSDDMIAKAYLLQAIGESEHEKDIESDLEL